MTVRWTGGVSDERDPTKMTIAEVVETFSRGAEEYDEAKLIAKLEEREVARDRESMEVGNILYEAIEEIVRALGLPLVPDETGTLLAPTATVGYKAAQEHQ